MPTKTLGIPDEYAIDPWGNRFVYAVTAKFTAVSGNADTRGLYVYPINSSATDALTKITINDETSSAITTKAILVILSHGPDGFGSYTRNGDRNAAYSANANQQTNCHCDNSGPTLMTSTFVMRPEFSDGSTSDNNFDDKMRFYGRDSFPLPWELPTEKN